MTDAERRLWAHLKARQVHGHHFIRQHVIGDYIVDFCCRKAMLVIEIDGGQHALATAKDRARTETLKKQGYTVIRFWNNDVFQDLEGVLIRIGEALVGAPV